ncbi:MAG: DUF255 domain-containing protein [Ignavibacteriae bacterium]|nr:MAG: DUF255 domain-containing protein [Ignavibacteriota bacterium]
MKKLIFSIFVIILFLNLRIIFSQGIQFTVGNWQSIKEKASIDNKIIMVDVFTDWCQPCKWMDENVFKNDTTGEFYNANFICWHIDAEKGEGIDFSKEYGVDVYPTILFIDANGKMLHKSAGAMPVFQFKTLGETALNPEIRLSALQDKYNNGERSLDFLSNYLKSLRASHSQMDKIVIEYFELQDKDKWISKENFDIINDYLFTTDNIVFEHFLQNRKNYIVLTDSVKVNNKIAAVCFDEAYQNVNKWTENDMLDYLKKQESKGAYFSDKFKSDVKLNFFEIKKDWNKYAVTASEYVDKKYIDYNDKMYAWMMLNNFAYTFYTNINDKKLLKKALGWTKKSIELDENYYNLDTYASLYYKLGDMENAKKYCEKAIKKAKETGDDSSSSQELLEKIKKMD